MIWFQDGEVIEESGTTVERVEELRQRTGTAWVSVAGLGDLRMLRQLADVFGLHRLSLADVVHTHQRPKLEDYPEHQFLVLRMLDDECPGETEQLSLFLGDDYVLTFEEHRGDCFDVVRHRLRDPGSRLRCHGVDYLAYALVDAIVDAYFPALERLGDRLEAIEDLVVAQREQGGVLQELHCVRRDLVHARRALWPLREVVAGLMRGDSRRVTTETRVYLRDVYDHVIQLLDLLENHRELGASLIELHLASASIRLNEVMKVLTMIATIFIPLTFVVGVYGMNFQFMPELQWRYGYPVVIGVMLAIGFMMVVWFRRRGWL